MYKSGGSASIRWCGASNGCMEYGVDVVSEDGWGQRSRCQALRSDRGAVCSNILRCGRHGEQSWRRRRRGGMPRGPMADVDSLAGQAVVVSRFVLIWSGGKSSRAALPYGWMGWLVVVVVVEGGYPEHVRRGFASFPKMAPIQVRGGAVRRVILSSLPYACASQQGDAPARWNRAAPWRRVLCCMYPHALSPAVYCQLPASRRSRRSRHRSCAILLALLPAIQLSRTSTR